MAKPHLCDDRCTECPSCLARMYYSPSLHAHACVDPNRLVLEGQRLNGIVTWDPYREGYVLRHQPQEVVS